MNEIVLKITGLICATVIAVFLIIIGEFLLALALEIIALAIIFLGL